jgi:7,8-dihydropterin-6-yl-methyl-4-(beta-D-ribofuranosyl)aminobenzene 5'-phosphate synthase
MPMAGRYQEREDGVQLRAGRVMLFQLLRYASAVVLGVTIGGAFVAAMVIREQSGSVPATHEVSIVTVFDNYAVNPKLTTQWGFAAVVMTPSAEILFDTGSDGQILLSNLAKLNIRPKDIQKVVISHVHLDHLGGLEKFLRANSDVEVYIPASFPDSVRELITSSGARYRDITSAVQIDERVYTTGEMGTSPIEQSLVIDTNEGLVVLTGCAHPGIVNIVRRAKEVVPSRAIALVMGGFHLRSASDKELAKLIQDFRQLGVKKVAPSHCSGERARGCFQKEYKDNYVAGGVGNVVTLRWKEPK